MKKIFLSLSLIFGFTVYAEYQYNSPSSIKNSEAVFSRTVQSTTSPKSDSLPSVASTDIQKDVPKRQPVIRSDGEENNDENEYQSDDEEEIRNVRQTQTVSSRTSFSQTSSSQKSSAQTIPMMNMNGNMMMNKGQYKNGEYTGNIADAYYGNLQVKATIAGGIGITPFRSMIKFLLDNNERRAITILYSNKTAADIAYKDIFDIAERQLGIKTVYAITDQSQTPSDPRMQKGFIDKKMIMEKIPDYKDRIFYISGPHSMVVAFEKTLREMGIKKNKIKIDFFPGFA